MMFCKFFGCKFIKVEKQEPIDVLFKIRYTFYKECVRCKSKIEFSSYLN